MRSQAKKFARIGGLQVAVCGERELSRYTRCEVTHVLSIWDSQQIGNDEPQRWIRGLFPDCDIHFAYFDDITRDAQALGAPSLSEVQRVLSIASALPENACVLVHCRAGISRSSAVALALMSQRAGPGNERECLRGLLQIRPHALPNALILSHADQVLGAGSKLSTTLAQIPAVFRELLAFL